VAKVLSPISVSLFSNPSSELVFLASGKGEKLSDNNLLFSVGSRDILVKNKENWLGNFLEGGRKLRLITVK
jgi:hypothetical protein